ncbi:MAG: peptide ABC transporter permease [Ignavibacteriae bacterium HGW-Ignavibacteriae-2]|jgi:putative ABC transport system permease protein|nr:MAG: peptide ABC transporter permease [Ignavibacteriae bacterium HGW-Ignavibacteriae-2]
MESIKVAFSSLMTNKLRSSLTILGIVVGIFSIISVSTIISMLQNSIEQGVSMLGQNTFQIQKYPVIMSGDPSERSKYRNRKDITLEDYENFKDRLVEAKYVGAEQWNFGKIFQSGNKETNPNIQFCGCVPEAFPNNKWEIKYGRIFNYDDVNHFRKVVIIGADIAKSLFNNSDPINKEVKVDGKKLKIIGVLESQGSMFGNSQDNFAVTPITTFQSFYGKRSRSINITVMSHDNESYNNVIELATGYMRIVRGLQHFEDDDFSIFSNESILTQLNSITLGFRVGAFVIAAIALLAAGIGIMNIMLVSVTERTKEIGIRKSVGAKKRSILFQFLTEAITLCLFGGLLGIILGLVAGNLIGSLLVETISIPLDYISVGVILCLIIGVIFGTYPAYKAANLDPIEALRYE